MWKYLFNVYIVQPREKDEMRFSNFCSLLAIFSVITLLQINYILYPSPELSNLKKAEGVLVDVKDNTGGRHSTASITILKNNNEKVKVRFSSTKGEVEFYEESVGKPIQVWYRWNMFQNSARQIILDNTLLHAYSKEKQLKANKFSVIFLYITIPLWFYTLLRPWVPFINQKFKSFYRK